MSSSMIYFARLHKTLGSRVKRAAAPNSRARQVPGHYFMDRQELEGSPQ